MNCEEANRISMIEFLSGIGHQPKKIRRMDYWYLSPLRDESEASFKVNSKINCWYDHGLGKGGSLIDFVMLYNHCDVKEALQKINSGFDSSVFKSNLMNANKTSKKSKSLFPAESDGNLEVISARQPIVDPWLRHCAKQRNIKTTVLNKWCYEVDFTMHNKHYKVIGFRNDAGGYELRNNWFKGSCLPKSVSLIEKKASDVSVFEGFLDFLTYQSVCQDPTAVSSDFLILNSLAFFEANLEKLQKYQQANLFLDHDNTERKWTEFALSTSPSFQDKSKLYHGYKDLDDWLVNFGKKVDCKINNGPR